MDEIVKGIFTAPLATVFVIAGVIFLLVAVVGNISGKIEPGVKGRVISGILGLAFIIIGLSMHFMQKIPQVPDPREKAPEQSALPGTPQTSMASLPMVKSDQKPNNVTSPTLKNHDSGALKSLTAETIFEGVIANATRFEKTGELVTLELTFQNITSKEVAICADELEPWNKTEIIDETTGDSWSIKYYGGQINCSDKIRLAQDKSHVMWMKFNIKNPEVRKFTLSWHILKRPLEDLLLFPFNP
jgi:hypothetical protein